MKSETLERKIEKFRNRLEKVELVDIHGKPIKTDNLTIKPVKNNYSGLTITAFLGLTTSKFSRRSFLKGLGLAGLGTLGLASVARAEQYELEINHDDYYIYRDTIDINSDIDLGTTRMIERASYHLNDRNTGWGDVDLLDFFEPLTRSKERGGTVRWRDKEDIPINVFLDEGNAPDGYVGALRDAMNDWAQQSGYANVTDLFNEVGADPSVGIKIIYDPTEPGSSFSFPEQGFDYWHYPIKGEMRLNPNLSLPGATADMKLEFGHGLVLSENANIWDNIVMGNATDVHTAEGESLEHLHALPRGTDMRKYCKI